MPNLNRAMRCIRLVLLCLVTMSAGLPAHSAFGIDGYPTPAGDLDGDGLRDVIVQAGVGSDTFTVTALKGTDGSTLWTSAVTIPAEPNGAWNTAIPLALGGSGAPGVLILCGRDSMDHKGLHLIALGSDGAELWRRSEVGRFDEGLSINAPSFYGTLRASGVADDMLIGRLVSAGSSPAAGLLEVAVVSGEDGSALVRTTALAIDVEARAMPIGDASGDGLDDFGVVSTAGIVPAPSLSAHRGTDGARLWTTVLPGAGGSREILPVPDATGDGRGEVAIFAIGSNPGTPNLSLHDGANGGMRWVRSVDHVTAIGDVDGDGLSEVLTVNETYVPSPGSVTATLRFDAVSGTGGTRYSIPHTFTFGLGGSAPCGTFGPAGDVHDDGDVDVRYQVYADCRYRSPAQGGVVSGETGVVLWSAPVAGDALAATVDGSGEDLVRLVPSGASTTVTVTDGAAGSIVWTAQAPGVYPGSMQAAVAADLDGDGRAEVMPLIYGGPVTALRGIDGTILWTR